VELSQLRFEQLQRCFNFRSAFAATATAAADRHGERLWGQARDDRTDEQDEGDEFQN
jgi:hypothetical protein